MDPRATLGGAAVASWNMRTHSPKRGKTAATTGGFPHMQQYPSNQLLCICILESVDIQSKQRGPYSGMLRMFHIGITSLAAAQTITGK